MPRPKEYCNTPLHGYSHFDEMSYWMYWFEDEDFYEIVTIQDTIALGIFQLLYGSSEDFSEFEQNRANYKGTYVLRVTAQEADEESSDCLSLTWDPLGASTERPYEDKQRSYSFFGETHNLLTDPILHQEVKAQLFDLPLTIPLMPLVKSHRQRLDLILSEL